MKRGIAFLLLMIVCLSGCATSQPTAQEKAKESALTQGMAKKYIYNGKTTQAEVMEIFGPPTLVTRKDNKEVWTYDKVSQDVSASSGFLTIILAGMEKSQYSSSSKSSMLIIYFDEKDIVSDYKLSVSKY